MTNKKSKPKPASKPVKKPKPSKGASTQDVEGPPVGGTKPGGKN